VLNIRVANIVTFDNFHTELSVVFLIKQDIYSLPVYFHFLYG